MIKASFKIGDTITTKLAGGTRVTGKVIDASDPSLLLCEAPSGASFKIGKVIAELVPAKRTRKKIRKTIK